MRDITGANVCVVGGAGFLGSHLVDYLIEKKRCNVLVIDNLVVGRLDFVNKAAVFMHHDITGSEEALRRELESHSIEFLFNYAAYPYVPDSFVRPLHIFNVNAFGALKVINAAAEAGCKAILQVSSAELYGNHPKDSAPYNLDDQRLNEEDPVNPHSSYGASKSAIDSLVQVRWKESKTPVIALRQFNCVGERETHPYIVPEIISQLYGENGVKGVLKLGNNTNRDFLYAGDAVRMATELLEKGEFGEVYNLGSQESISIYKLAQTIADIIHGGHLQFELDPLKVRPWDIWHLQSDNTKIYKIIESRPEASLIGALKRTVQWYRNRGKVWPWEDRLCKPTSDLRACSVDGPECLT